MHLLIVGGTGGTAVGESLLRATRKIPVSAVQMDSSEAYRGPWLPRAFAWRLCGRQPLRLRAFGEAVRQRANSESADLILATGIAPLNANALAAMRAAGRRTVCYLTDDPWNPAHRAPWFLRALGEYDSVFTTRESNVDQLRAACCGSVNYLPFGYDETLFFPDAAAIPDSGADIVFVGTCDADRVPILAALREAGFRMRVFGSYFDRWRRTRGLSEGQADAATIRRATVEGKINLCLVRRANRDGNVMRTFEMAACGACMLVEDTADHRRIFGRNGECVRFFHDIDSMLAAARTLLDAPAERARMRAVVLSLMQRADHTYTGRLREMLRQAGVAPGRDR